MSRKIILLSGGVDSLVILAMNASETPLCITYDYGQRHQKEIVAASLIAEHYKAEHRVVCLPSLRGSALTGDCEVPESMGDQSSTVVPGRNAIMLSFALNYAKENDSILFGAHAGDFAVYPDCRRSFVKRMSEVFSLAYGVSVEAPFVFASKTDIVNKGKELNVPFHLSWTCYRGLKDQCGECSACVGLRKAMSNG